ncbi:50S ribosomal protein bL37 [Micromonospora sp. NPDC005087]|uniref:50S ribosomal protein bL37 n=1 Tax=Micromonospora sp. NPDC005087 TaxID=3364225 RepID=UPI0036BDEDD8
MSRPSLFPMCLPTYPIMRRPTVGPERRPGCRDRPAGRRRVPAALPSAGRTRRRAAGGYTGAEAARRADPTHHEEVSMAKKSRKKKARKKNAANHGKRPNS